jgi:chromosome segregation ATPase
MTVALNQERQRRQEIEQHLQTVKQARGQADGHRRELLAEHAALKIQLAKVKHQHEQERQGADQERRRLIQDLEEHQATLDSIVTVFFALEEETGRLRSELAEEKQRVAQEKERAEQEKQGADELRQKVHQAIEDRDAASRELQGFLSDLSRQHNLLPHTNADDFLQPTPKVSGLNASVSSLRQQHLRQGGGSNGTDTARSVATSGTSEVTQQRHRRPRRVASFSSLNRIVLGDGREVRKFFQRRSRSGGRRLYASA